MFAVAEAGALVVYSVDGDYLRTPFTKAGWGAFDYNIVVGDTEAPSGSGPNDWQLVEGTSITAAAAVSLSLPFVFFPNRLFLYSIRTFLKKCKPIKRK